MSIKFLSLLISYFPEHLISKTYTTARSMKIDVHAANNDETTVYKTVCQ